MLSIEGYIDRGGLFLMTNLRCRPTNLWHAEPHDNARLHPGMLYERCRTANERRGDQITFMSFHLSAMVFAGKKVVLTWGFALLHNLYLRPVALLICSPFCARAAGLRGA